MTETTAVLLALGEFSIATFYEPATDIYFEARMLGDVMEGGIVMVNGPRRPIERAEALRRAQEYTKAIDEQIAYVGFKGKVLGRKAPD